MAKPGVLFFPSPGMGHLISMVEFAKQFESRFSVTVLIIPHLIPAWSSAITAYIESVISSGFDIRFEELPRIDPPQGENQRPETFCTRLIESYESPVKDAISRQLISSPTDHLPTVAAVILDLFCSSMIGVAGELGIPAYIYFTSNAAMLGSMLYLPTLHVKYPCEMKDVEGDIDIPGLPPVPPYCMPSYVMDKKNEAYPIFVDHGQRFQEAKGLLLNIFAELEPKTLQALTDGDYLPDHPTPPVFTVGPVLAVEQKKGGTERHDCIKWLDGQPAESVVFLCFGSMGSFEAPQVKEMAEGLERSGQRFLWCLRVPNSNDSFRMPTDANLDEVLPKGFLERTEGRGLVWPSLVPQAEILSHEAVGGFVTHCGWNSVLESLWFGVPMLGWPLHGEQHLNCLEMVKELCVALELKMDHNNGGFVRSEDLEKGVRSLMEECEEGKKVKGKVEEMKVASRRATMEGGSSYVALERFMGELSMKLPIANTIKDNHYVAPKIIAA